MNLNYLIDGEVDLTENQITRYEKMYGAAKEYEKIILENLKLSDSNLTLSYLSSINEKVRESLYFAIVLLQEENSVSNG